MLILGIETSCDETAAAVVKDGKEILSSIISSQVDIHSKYGGVVPELACRNHIENLPFVIKQALDEAKVNSANISAFLIIIISPIRLMGVRDRSIWTNFQFLLIR